MYGLCCALCPKATALIESLCSLHFCFSSPIITFQSRMVLSYEAEASVVPSGEKATALAVTL